MPNYRDLSATAAAATAGLRLDQGVAELFQLSRRRSRRAIDEGGVYLNKKRCRTAGRLLKQGDRVRIVLLEQEQLVAFKPEQLIWQQGPLYLLHKYSGQYAQEALHRSRGTLPDELARHLQLSPAQAARLRPVHRLDRGTSGLMLFSSDPDILQQLQQHWHNCTSKHYLAVVEPAPAWQQQRITSAIGKQRDQQGRYHLNEHGRACDSEAEVIERHGNRALLRLTPHTGRTHQLRVHMAAAGSPILGDIRYGGKAHARLMLHAEILHIDAMPWPPLRQAMHWQVQPEENWTW